MKSSSFDKINNKKCTMLAGAGDGIRTHAVLKDHRLSRPAPYPLGHPGFCGLVFFFDVDKRFCLYLELFFTYVV